MDGKMLDDMNNFQQIGSNRIKRLLHVLAYVVQETFSHCDRITDTTLPISFPVEKVRTEAASIIMYIDRQDGRHEYSKGCATRNTATNRF